MIESAVFDKGSDERRQKAARLRLQRAERRILNLIELIRTEKPATFSRLICEGVLGPHSQDSGLAALALTTEESRGNNTISNRFRYLAQLILKQLDEVPPDLSGAFIPLAAWIESDFHFDLDRLASTTYKVRFGDLSGTAGAHNIYVSNIRWIFFDEASEILHMSCMKAARMLYRGVRLYEKDMQSGDYYPTEWNDENYIFLRQKGRYEEVTTGHSLPDWATRYFLKAEQVKLHDALFHLDYDLSAVEIEYRRSVLMQQCAPHERMKQPSWPWGGHETALLQHLATAARQWWSTYDPEIPSTAPTNDEVTRWLETQGVARRVAEVMSQILRADGLAPGPRK